MEDFFEEIFDDIFVIALWDDTISAYVNSYFLQTEDEYLLIDSGSRETSDRFIKLLAAAGVEPEDIKTILHTHGHEDHIGASSVFPNASSFVHFEDLKILPPELSPGFDPDIVEEADRKGFDCLLLGHHTNGSVLLYHRKSEMMFCGDFVCFFGDPLPSDGIVSATQEAREIAYEFYTAIAQDPEMRKTTNFEPYSVFMQGLEDMQNYSPRAFCTGHGAVLVGGIPDFLDKLFVCSTKTVNY